MEEDKDVMIGNENIAEMMDPLRKSFDEMESHRECLSHDKSQFEDVKQHFGIIKISLQKKFDELETKERAFEEKKTEYRTLLAEREAAVTAKEQDLWDRLQELKDAAVSAIIEARKKYQASLENKVRTYTNDVPSAPIPAPEKNIPINKLSPADSMTCEVKSRPQLKQLCEQMDAKGLLKFISDNRKVLATIPDELPLALRGAGEPAHLVLNALEALYPQNQFQSSQKTKVLHRTCLLLMESATPILGMTEPGCDNLLNSEIKQRAKVIADKWKAKLAEVDLDASNGYSLEALAFLQLLVTFNISSEFDEDELCKFLVAVSRHRRQAPELCRALGVAHKTQDVIGALVSKGRQIDAVYFSIAFQLTEIFPPVPLLKQYLEDMKKTITQTNAADAERDTINQELGALKAVIKCIEEYKLQEECPLDALQVRIAQIEKTKAGKKRNAYMTQVLRKKPWVVGGYASQRTPIAVDRLQAPNVYDERAQYYGDGVRYPYAAASPAYEVPSHVPYSHQTNAPWPHHYPDERVPPPYRTLSNYGNYMSPAAQSTPVNYGNYMSSGMQPAASSNYGSYMGSSVPSSHQSYL